MKKYLSIIVLLFAVILLASCGTELPDSLNDIEVNKGDKSLKVSVQSLSFEAAGGSDSFTITSNTTWSVTSDQSWCTVSPSSGSGNGVVTVRVQENTSPDSRSASITVKAGDLSQTITVRQVGGSATLQIDKTSMSFELSGGSDSFTITSNTTWTVTSDQSWCTVNSSSGSGNTTIIVNVLENTSKDLRSATITVKASDLSQTIHVTQAGAQLFVYFIGATDGWANAEQKLESVNSGGVYTGYVYCADIYGWGNEFKFQRVPGSWDDEINSGTFTGGITGDFEDGGGGTTNIRAKAGEGVYYVTMNLTENTLNAVRIYNMNLVGDYNGWNPADDSQQMTWNATEYCFEISGAAVTSNGWKFTANNSWDINLGVNGGGTNIDDLVANGDNISVEGKTIKLYPTRKTSDKIYCTVK